MFMKNTVKNRRVCCFEKFDLLLAITHSNNTMYDIAHQKVLLLSDGPDKGQKSNRLYKCEPKRKQSSIS